MPPFVGRKRLSTSPPTRPRQPPAKKLKVTNDRPSSKRAQVFPVDSDSDSSLSELESDEFEDVKADGRAAQNSNADYENDLAEDEDELVEWEDAANPIPNNSRPMPEIRDLRITIQKENEPDYGQIARAAKGKTGPTKREKLARVQTHQLHVQFLLWHNTLRNRWLNDKEVQNILVEQLPPQIAREVERWRRASGLDIPERDLSSSVEKKRSRKPKANTVQKDRHWGKPSSHLEPGKADMSSGDPLITFLKILSAYWKRKFAITAPGLRKRGYGTKLGLRQDISSFRNEEHDQTKHGERVRNLQEFQELARKCEGSRDVGAQLFTALLRGLGIETRLIASLQPAGYGWMKAEQMVPKKLSQLERVEITSGSGSDDTDPEPVVKRSKTTTFTTKPLPIKTKPTRSAGVKNAPIDLDTEAEDDSLTGDSLGDDNSVVDVTPSMRKVKPPKFDSDLAFPIYWSEAISPITQKVLPVSPLVLGTPVASTAEVLSTFEPRGAKAEKARQVIAYVLAYSSDGTAKDVTVRYLRKRLWPGKTKPFRYPVEKIPVYDKKGKIKKYEDYDWFKRVLSPYTRSDTQRTAADDIEDSTDLVPSEPEKKQEPEFDTLQSLKASPDFVLERFLRREEALKPGAKPSRYFNPPATKKAKSGEEIPQEPVYNRKDVLRCLTAESWHKEGRRPCPGSMPLKLVPVRAVTLTRKREAEEHEARTGEKQMQGLYSQDQTEWIIPPPISNGMIPKNAYGNIDAFVPSMVPQGAVHIPLNGLKRICKKLEIDFAEAVTGFEFGNKMAVPVITGVVVAKEHEKSVREAWRQWNEDQKRKQETKMEKLILDLWRKFVIGLRIRERVRNEYGTDLGRDMSGQRGHDKENAIHIDVDDGNSHDTSGPGGFLPEANSEEFGGGFLLPHEDEDVDAGELILDDGHTASQKKIDHEKPTSEAMIVHSAALTKEIDSEMYRDHQRKTLTRLMTEAVSGLNPDFVSSTSTSALHHGLNQSPTLKKATSKYLKSARDKGYKSINQRIRERDEFGRKKTKRPAVRDEKYASLTSESPDSLSEVDTHENQNAKKGESQVDVASELNGFPSSNSWSESDADSNDEADEYIPTTAPTTSTKKSTTTNRGISQSVRNPNGNTNSRRSSTRIQKTPRKGQASNNSNVSAELTPKRSIRSSRKRIQPVTSPYFEQR